MNVSSVTSNWWKYLQRLQNSSAADQSSAAQTTATTSETKSRYEGQDSETAAAFFSGLMSQGLVPVNNSTSSDATGSSSDSSAATTLSALTSVSGPDSAANLETTLSSFLDKVKNGTVTDDDLTALQSALADIDDTSMLAAAPPPPPPPQNANRDELGALQNLLASLSDSSEESDTAAAVAGTSASSTDSSTSSSSTTSSTTSTDTSSTTASDATSASTSSSFSLASFLQKVEDGTVTTDDLNELADLLKEIEAESQAAFMPPPPPPPMQVAASAYDTNQGYSVASTDSTTAAQSV